jgi:transcriptional regulator with XRE-family HTH domain
MTNHKMIGRRIAQTRRDMGATQVEMAEAVGVSRPQLTGIEGGGTTSLPTIIAIADYLKVPLDWLLGRKVPPGGPLVGHFIYEPDQLALFRFWDALSIEERRAVFITLRISPVSGTGT